MKIISCAFLFLVVTVPLWAQQAEDYLRAGNQFYQAKDYGKAERYYQAAAQMDPKSWAAFQGIGNCDYMLGKKMEALDGYQRALNLAPQDQGLQQMVRRLRSDTVPSPVLPERGMPAKESDGTKSENLFEIGLMGRLGATDDTASKGLLWMPGACLELGYWIAPQWELGFSSDYQTYTIKSAVPDVSSTIRTDVDTSLLNLDLFVKYGLGGDGLRPFFLMGAGLSLSAYSTTLTNDPFDDSPVTQISHTDSNDSEPLIEVGAGAEAPLSPDLGLSFSIKYQLILEKSGNTNLIPIDVGVNFHF